MKRLREALAKLAQGLGLSKTLLARAQRRYAANRKRAYTAHMHQLRAQARSDRLRGEGRPVAAAVEEKVVARCRVRAERNHLRAQHFLGVAKRLAARVESIEHTQADLEAALRRLSHVTIHGDKATGGTPSERLKAVALASAAACASGRRRNFYSQSGAWDVTHCISGPALGHRDDCSSWVTSVCHAAGLPDPNGGNYVSGGYTGTLLEHCKRIPRSELEPGDLVVYGAGTAHHVEMFVGPGTRTIGHGSAPVDAGTIDLFGPGEVMTFLRVPR